MPIPQTKAIMLPLLQFAVDGKEHTVDEAEENLASHFNLTKNERAVIKKSGGETTFLNRLRFARTHLERAILLDRPKTASLKITKRGSEILKDSPSTIDERFLRNISTEYAAWEQERLQKKKQKMKSTQYIALEDPKEIDTAQKMMSDLLKNNSTKSGTINLGYPAGNRDVEVFWAQDYDMWWGYNRLEDEKIPRHWNPFGKGEPEWDTNHSHNITCEINMPLSVATRMVSGLFVKDNEENYYVAHDGGIGGGKKGIGRSNFEDFFADPGAWTNVSDQKGNRRMILVSNLEDDEAVSQISNFVNKVYEFKNPEINYWKISPGTQGNEWDEQRDNKLIGIHFLDPGDLSKTTESELQEKIKNAYGKEAVAKRANTFGQMRDFLKIKKGDIIVANRGKSKILGIGKVTGSYQYQEGQKHPHTFPVDWYDTNEREITMQNGWMVTVIQLTKKNFDDLIGEKTSSPTLTQVTTTEFEEYFDILERKKQLIFYGPPGTGKTYTANAVAEAWVSENPSQEKQYIRKVTFHPSYSYEEFVEGIKPKPKGQTLEYPIEPGIFKIICGEAKNDPETKYVLFIDEINRGNISKIFGELITLIEKDKRDVHSLQLAYSKEEFTVPQNLYIIGTMNTADRSLTQIDAALRRRFGFSELMPKPELLPQKIEGVSLRDLLVKLNARITNEGLREKQIGHSYLMSVQDLKDLQFTFSNEIVPLLQDYFYDDYKKLEEEILSDKFIDSEKMIVKDDWKKDSKIFLSAIKKTFQL